MRLDLDEVQEQLVQDYAFKLANEPDFVVLEMIKALGLDSEADLAGNISIDPEGDTLDIEPHIWNDVDEDVQDRFEHCDVDATIDLDRPQALDEFIMEREGVKDRRTDKFYEGDTNLIVIDEV